MTANSVHTGFFMICIILLNWNDAQNTINCIRSILKNVMESKCVVIVDNNSDDNSIHEILLYLKEDNERFNEYKRNEIDEAWQTNNVLSDNVDFIVIYNDKNGGFAYGNNSGIMYALIAEKCSYIWLLNTDTEIEKSTLSEMLITINAHDSNGFCGSVLMDYNDRKILQCYGGATFYPFLGKGKLLYKGYKLENIPQKRKTPSYIMGASLLIKKNCAADIGFLNESYFMFGEENEWQYKAKKRNYKIVVSPNSIVYHKGSVSLSGRSVRYHYLINYSSIKFIRENHGLLTAFIASISLCFISMYQLIREKPKLYAALLGIKDGVFAKQMRM